MIKSFLVVATLVVSSAGAVAEAPQWEPAYAATLAALRAQIVPALPVLDPQRVADFRQAYAAEGVAQSAYEASLKGKAHIGASTAESKAGDAQATLAAAADCARAQARMLAAAQPLLAAADALLASDAGDKRLVKCALLAEATPAGLAKFARQGKAEEALVVRLLADDELMKQMLIAGGAKGGNYGRAMQIYAAIQQASAKAGTGILQRLALSTSLEQAVQGGKGGVFDPVKRYLSYEKAYLDGELDPAFKTLNAWECRFVTDAPETDEDLAWCREMLRNYRPDQIYEPDYRWRYSRIVRTDVPYKDPDAPVDDGTSRIQQLLAGGGKCGPRAFVGRLALRAFGIPTWGVTQPGHAALAHWTPAGWTINLGADWKFSWWEDRPGPDFHLESQARAYPQEFAKALRAQWIGAALGEPEVDSRQPGSGGLWHALALALEKASVAGAKPVPLAGEDLAEASEPTQAEEIMAAKITEADRRVVTDAVGVITIPAAACSRPKDNTKNINFMKSFTGGMQMAYHQDEAFEYAFAVSAAGRYALTARVVTVHKNQRLEVAANGGAKPLALPLPYTLGRWQDTRPVVLTLSPGMTTLRFTGTKDNMGMTIKQFTLTPVK